MLGKKESLCLDAVVDFIKKNPRFRPMTLGEINRLFRGLDPRRTFLLLKGSYGAHDCVIAILLDYDVSSMPTLGNPLGLFYRIYCKPPVEITFTRETASDRVTKQIGLTVEIEVNNPVIDDHYLIHSNDEETARQVTSIKPLSLFLEKNYHDLEKFEITLHGLDYQRSAPLDLASPEWIDRDLDALLEVARSFSTEEESSESDDDD